MIFAIYLKVDTFHKLKTYEYFYVTNPNSNKYSIQSEVSNPL